MERSRQKDVCHKKGDYSQALKKSPFENVVAEQAQSRRGCECLKPCRKSYLNFESPGTSTHRKYFGWKTKFRGCQQIEDKLIARRLVSYELREKLGVLAQFFEYQLSDRNELVSWGHLAEALETSINQIGDERLSELKQYELSVELGWGDDREETLRQMELIEEKIKRKRRHSSPRFKRFMKSLTNPQREIVVAYYLDNPRRLTAKQIATRLGITYAAFRDRLTGVKKKFRDLYLEKKVKPKLNLWDKDLIYGFWRKSCGEEVSPVKYENFVIGTKAVVDAHEFDAFRNAMGPRRPRVLKWLGCDNGYQQQHSFNDWQTAGLKKVKRVEDLFDQDPEDAR